MRTADVVIYIFDANTESEEAIKKQVAVFDSFSIKYLLVGNKADVNDNIFYAEKFSQTDKVNLISAKNDTGINELKTILYNHTVNAAVATDHTIVTNARHYEALQQIQQSLLDIKTGLDSKLSGDLLAPDIRKCLYYLGEITGEVTNEDKLDYIFSKFCIGK